MCHCLYILVQVFFPCLYWYSPLLSMYFIYKLKDLHVVSFNVNTNVQNVVVFCKKIICYSDYICNIFNILKYTIGRKVFFYWFMNQILKLIGKLNRKLKNDGWKLCRYWCFVEIHLNWIGSVFKRVKIQLLNDCLMGWSQWFFFSLYLIMMLVCKNYKMTTAAINKLMI